MTHKITRMTAAVLLSFGLLTSCGTPDGNETFINDSQDTETQSPSVTDELSEKNQLNQEESKNQPVSLSRASDILSNSETITINWFNTTTEKTVYYDGTFRIERRNGDAWVDCTPENPTYDLTQQTIPPRTVIKREYTVTGFDLSRDVPYRFISQYNETGDSKDNVEIVMEFRVGYNFKPLEPQQAMLNHNIAGVPRSTYTKKVTYYYCRSGSPSRDGEEDKYFHNNPALAELFGFTADIPPYINADKFDLNGVRPIPLVRIDSVEDLELLRRYNSSRAWQFLVDSYDAEFFKTKTLFLLSFNEGSGSTTHTIGDAIIANNDAFYIRVDRTIPELGTDDMLYCEILIEIEREDIVHCVEFDAWMQNK